MSIGEFDSFDAELRRQFVRNLVSGGFVDLGFHWHAADASVLCVTRRQLHADAIERQSRSLRIWSGFDLDGERLASPLPPSQSGNGIEGGNFVSRFRAGHHQGSVSHTAGAQRPLGSLVYDSRSTGAISPTTDSDSFTLSIDPGQTITVVASSNATLAAEGRTVSRRGKVPRPLGQCLGRCSRPGCGDPDHPHIGHFGRARPHSEDLPGHRQWPRRNDRPL